MKLKIVLLLPLLFVPFWAGAQNPKTEEERKYLEVLKGRSEKIVEEYLNIEDKKKAIQIGDIIAKQYWDVNKVHDTRDAKIKELKSGNLSEEEFEAKEKKLQEVTSGKLQKLHKKYIAALKKYLTNDEVDAVKNGMTYNIFNHTYNGYLDMLPQLTEGQKAKIYAWLVEAREKAMDEGSSKRKHYWFGKYKGKINNYLSQEGYDLNKASQEWHERLKKESSE
jgi:hypothetical protein